MFGPGVDHRASIALSENRQRSLTLFTSSFITVASMNWTKEESGMRHKKAATGAAAVLALGIGATAVAAPGGDGPLGGVFGPGPQERRAEQAQDLAKELNLPEDRVRRAIDRVGEKRRAEHQAEKAKELAKRLGVSEGDAAKALAKGREALRKEFQSQRSRRNFRPRAGHDAFIKAIAESLDKSTDEVKKALKDIRQDRLNAELAEAVKEGRLTQKQADQIKKRAEAGRAAHALPPPPRRAWLRARRTRWARRTAAWRRRPRRTARRRLPDAPAPARGGGAEELPPPPGVPG